MRRLLTVAALFAAPAAAGQEVKEPTTVNGNALGSIDEFQTLGPGRICLANAAFDLLEGERATLQYAGIHSASFIVTRPDGNLLVEHGNAWAPRRERMTTVWKQGGQSIRRFGRGETLKYLYYAPAEYSEDKAVATLFVSGKGLNGGDGDIPLLKRLTLHADTPPDCLRRYVYGWSMLFGDEPLSTDKK